MQDLLVLMRDCEPVAVSRLMVGKEVDLVEVVEVTADAEVAVKRFPGALAREDRFFGLTVYVNGYTAVRTFTSQGDAMTWLVGDGWHDGEDSPDHWVRRYPEDGTVRHLFAIPSS